ncbi:hypothetical protein E1269_15565 [Jiangella asiatica]|uniref:Type II toxin-antitoxin system PemK/MazF family toxin n=1 Tax=Jiangella asiatica TaxID=2530372 RepID=A0A4R5D6M9_9ACTN|nr:hypothetical protein E1269_15565 [Jiangella asiatica]
MARPAGPTVARRGRSRCERPRRRCRGSRGHERGKRYAVVVQSDLLPLSTWLVAPTSTSARPTSFRPEVEISGKTNVLGRPNPSHSFPAWPSVHVAKPMARSHHCG